MSRPADDDQTRAARNNRHLRITRPRGRIHVGAVHGIQERVRLGVFAGWIHLPRDAELLSFSTPKGWARASRAGRPTAGSRYCGRRSAFPTSGSSRGISLSAGRAEAMVRFAGVRSPMWCSATAGTRARRHRLRKKGGRASGQSVMRAVSLYSVIGRANPCSSQTRCSLSSVSSSPGSDPLAGCEGRRQMAHPLNHPDTVVMHGPRGVAAVIRQAIEHRREHRLEHRPRDVGTGAAMDAQPEAEVPIAISVQDDWSGCWKRSGVPVSHRPGQP